MGRLVRIVNAKKQKIVNTLISENVYQPADRPFLLELPLKNLEEILSLRIKSCFKIRVIKNNIFQPFLLYKG
ncbi:hypothetical protein ACWF7H_29280, partial [Peribacillus butanolivorans]